MSLTQVLQRIQQIDPKFKQSRSPLNGVLGAVQTGGKDVAKSLQQELDLLEISDAQRFAAALQILINDNPQVCYTRVQLFSHTSEGGAAGIAITTGPIINRKVYYTSAKFTATCTVYCIAPATGVTHELGFIQHCTSKSDESTYSDGSSMADACKAGFPVGDSSGADHAPFYYKGLSHGCNRPAWYDLKGSPAGLKHLEVNDYFNNNCHFYHPFPTPTSVNLSATLQKIRRAQSFTLWVARKQGKNVKLLREVRYTINVSVDVKNGVISIFNSNCDNISKRIPGRYDALPHVKAPDMNHRSQWRYRAPKSGTWVALT